MSNSNNNLNELLQYDSLHNLYQVITTIVLIIFVPMECFRLYLGYMGNLLEKVSSSITFHPVEQNLLCRQLNYYFHIFCADTRAGWVLDAVYSLAIPFATFSSE